MNLCNYLYNISLLELFIEMGHWILSIKPVYFNFWIKVGPDYSVCLDKYGKQRSPFDLDFVEFGARALDIKYYKGAKEMKLIWHVQEK